MPYEKSPAKLEALVKQVLDDPNDTEIRDGISLIRRANRDIETVEAEPKDSELYAAITKDADEIWAVVTSEVLEYDNSENQLQSAEKTLASSMGPEPDPESAPKPKESSWLITVSFIALIAIIYFFYKQGWSGAVSILGKQGAIALLVTALVFIAAPFTIYLVLQKRRLARANRARQALEESRKKWLENKKAGEVNAGIDRFRTVLADLNKMIEKSLLEKKIKPKLRVIVNRSLEPSYDHQFSVIGAKGLSEVFDPGHAIDTTAKQRLRFMMENTPGGSIGIAGPRGAGKTTLMLSYCGPKPTVDKLNNRPILSVLASAPVQYEARDFILYLFSALCYRVLDKLGESYDQSELQDVETARESLFGVDLKVLRRLALVLLYVGAIMISISLLLAILLTRYPEAKPGTAANSAAVTQTASNTPADATPAASERPAEPTFVRFIKALEIKPTLLLTTGVVFCLLAGVPFLARRARRREMLAVEKSPNPADAAQDTTADSADAAASPPPTAEEQLLAEAKPGLIGESKKWLRKIKFQQSYTSGWTGALKLPVGLEGGVSSAVTLAENQLSLPEIVHSFTKFISKLSLHYQVIIGIDELDKLESDEKAQRFLNEIKSIFGLESCFYLISVSENAMSNFERRGLPFRDVFDSSFDSIIYVDYLNFAGAKRLLRERVTGKPIPFFALSYCLAGGLPRDLIRNFRALLELSQRDDSNGPAQKDLATLCCNLVKEDLKGKIRAVGVAAKRLEVEPEAGKFLENAYRLDTDSLTPAHLLTTIPSLLLEKPVPVANNDAAKNLFKKHEDLTNLKRELTVYSYYLMTLLEFFNKNLTQVVLEPAEKAGAGLDLLARARQALAVDPNITREQIDQFRKDQGMTPLPSLPAPSEPLTQHAGSPAS